MKYKKILITGSAGFIGFHLASELLAGSVEVVGIDSISDYYDVGMKNKRNSILLKNKKYRFYKINLKDYKKLASIVVKEKPDLIVHLAAQAGVRYSLVNPWAYVESNYLGTLNIFEVAKNCGVKRVIFASSASVYGNNTKMPFAESDRTDNPISIYGATKKANELLAYSYHSLYGIEVAGIRFFTVYGRYGRPDLALFKFAKSILAGKTISVFNKGKMSRTFTHITDAVAGVMAIINKVDLQYEVYNIGGGQNIQLLEFIKVIEKKIGKKAKMRLLPMQQGDIPNARVDLSKAKKQLGYSPKMPVKDGVEDFIEWFLENKSWLLKLKDSE